MNLVNSKVYYEKACRVIPTGVSSSMRKNVDPILYFEKADGPYYYDVDGHEYIDYTLAWGPLILGSNNEAINKSVISQLSKSYTLGAQHELEIELAEKMVHLLPGVEQVLFSNTGTEAIQSAIRIARAYTGRIKIVKFEGHYHGWTNNVLVSYKPSADDLGKPSATCGGQPASEFADTLVLPWNDIDALKTLLSECGEEIACVITEPILVNSGSCMPQEDYLKQVIELCRQYGIVSIFDEVITGFRLALGGAREYFKLDPDLSVYAKAIAGGFTFSAIGGKIKIFDVLRNGTTIHAGTYNGASVNLAAANATLSELSKPGCFERMHKIGYAIRETIEREAQAADVQVITSGVGSFFSVHFGMETPPKNYADTMSADKEFYSRFRAEMLKRGVLLLPDSRWYIGASHSDTELEKTTIAIRESFQSLK